MPGQTMPGQTLPGQTLPGQAMSGQPMPGQQPNRTEPAPGGEKKPKKKMSRGKKAALFGSVGVVLLGIIAVLVLFVFLPMRQVQKVDPNSLYARGCEVYYLNEKGEEVPLTNQLFTDNSIDNQTMASEGQSLGYYIAFSDDGTRIFYPDQAQSESYGPPLYTRLMSEPADKAVLIDDEVAQYQVSSDGKTVTYIKGSNRGLYQSDLEKKTRIAADAGTFVSSPDGQTVFYADATGVMYQWTSEGGSKQITENSDIIMGIGIEKMAVYYMQDGALYEYVAGSGGAKQIATGAQEVVWITADGEVYYTVDGSDGKTMMDFVEDDVTANGGITQPAEPEAPEAPSSSDYKDEEAYRKALEQYAKDWEAYNEAMGEWEQAMSDYYDYQDSMETARWAMEELESASASGLMTDLYYYDGTTATLVAEHVSTDNWQGTFSLMSREENSRTYEPRGFVTQFDPTSTGKILLSDVLTAYEEESYYEISQVVQDKLKENMDSGLMGIVVQGTCTFGTEGMVPVAFSWDGSLAYVLEKTENGSSLCRYPIEDGKPGTRETFAIDAYPVAMLKDGHLVYSKTRGDGNQVDAYVSGTDITDTVVSYDTTQEAVQGTSEHLAYFSSWDSETESGTLRVWENGGATTVASGVRSFQMREDGSVLYLYNFDETTGTGTLGLYQNGTMTVLNNDTNCLIPTTDRVMYGDY